MNAFTRLEPRWLGRYNAVTEDWALFGLTS